VIGPNLYRMNVRSLLSVNYSFRLVSHHRLDMIHHIAILDRRSSTDAKADFSASASAATPTIGDSFNMNTTCAQADKAENEE
jgi:hypothetical protein